MVSFVGGVERIELMEVEFGKRKSRVEINRRSIYRNGDNRNDLTIAKAE